MEPYICDKMKYFVCLLLEVDEVYLFNLYLFSPINIFFCLQWVSSLKPSWWLDQLCSLFSYLTNRSEGPGFESHHKQKNFSTKSYEKNDLFTFYYSPEIWIFIQILPHSALCRLSDINNFLDRSRTFQAATIVERSTWIFFFYKLLNSIESLKQSYLGR